MVKNSGNIIKMVILAAVIIVFLPGEEAAPPSLNSAADKVSNNLKDAKGAAAGESKGASVSPSAGVSEQGVHIHSNSGDCCGYELQNSNILIVYENPGNKNFKKLKEEIAGSEIFENLVRRLALYIALPSEIKVRLCSLGKKKVCYDAEKKEILVAYELLEYFAGLLESEEESSEDEKAALFADLVFFITLHELGRAFIDIFNLPVTGKEEDAADLIASWIILKSYGDQDHQAVISLVNASQWLVYKSDASRLKAGEVEFAGCHSLDPQRFFNMITWAYGFNPNAVNAVLWEHIERVLPEERIEDAAAEFESIDGSFTILLKKYLK
jgi:hypothetical protein